MDEQRMGAGANRVGAVFRGLSASPSSGALTITYSGAGSVVGSTWEVVEFTGVDTSGTNGSGAVGTVASQQYTSASPTSLPFTITDTPGASDLAIAIAHTQDDGGPSTPATYTLIDQITGGETQTWIAYKTAGGSGSYGNDGSDTYWATHGFTVKAAAAGGSTTTKTVSESVALSESNLRYAFRPRTASDVIAVYDVGVFRNFIMSMSDASSVSDSAELFVRRVRAVSEIVTSIDSISEFYRRTRLVSDALTIIDSFVKVVIGGSTIAKIMSENVTVYDELAIYRTFRRLVTDTLQTVDALITSLISGNLYTKILGDTITVADASGVFLYRNRAISDVIATNDQLGNVLRRVRNIFDSLEIADGVVTVRWSTKYISELLGITDAAAATYVPYVVYLYDVRQNIGLDLVGRIDLDRFGILGVYS